MFKSKHTVNMSVKAFFMSSTQFVLRLKSTKDGFMVFENGDKDYTINHYSLTGEKLATYELVIKEQLLFELYEYIGNTLYMLFTKHVSKYEEILVIYKSNSDGVMQHVASIPRESYRHNMSYFKMVDYNGDARLVLIKHNRIHLYSITDKLNEIETILGDKWFISSDFVINAMGYTWDVYDTSLSFITGFNYREDVNFIVMSASKDKSIISMISESSAGDSAGLYIFDDEMKEYSVFYQKYNFKCLQVCGDKIWVSVSDNNYGNISGIMIFDKGGEMEYSNISNNSINYPEPVITSASYICEVGNGEVLLSNNDKIIISDAFCNKLQEIKHNGYDSYFVSDDKKHLFVYTIENRNYTEKSDVLFNATVEIHEWDNEWQQADVVDIVSFIK